MKPLVPGLALLVAVTVMSGCQSRIGTNYGAPGLPVPTQANPQAPVAPAAATPTVGATTVAGLARLAGQPMANASLKVENAISGAPMNLLLTDGRQVSGGDASLTTDAEGRFSLRVVGIDADQVLRVVATSGDKTLSALVSGDGVNLSGYALLDTTFLVNVDEVSRAMDLVATGPLRLIAKTLKTSVGAEVRKALLDDLKVTTAKLVEAARTNPSLVTLLNNFSNLQTPAAQAEAVKQALTAANLSTEVNALVSVSMQATALKAQQATNLVEGYSTDAFQDVQLVGTNFQVNLGTNNSLQIVNTTTGQAISVTGTNTGSAPVSSGGSGGGGSSGGGSSNLPPFSPIVTAQYANGALEVTIAQDANEDEIATMVAEIPATAATLEADVSNGTAPKLDDDLDANESVLTFGGTMRQLDILKSAGAPTNVTLPTQFGGTTHTPVWQGVLKFEGAADPIGTFQVVEAGAKIYLVASYVALPSGFEITAARTATLKAFNALQLPAAAFSAQVLLLPRQASVPPVSTVGVLLP